MRILVVDFIVTFETNFSQIVLNNVVHKASPLIRVKVRYFNGVTVPTNIRVDFFRVDQNLYFELDYFEI